MYLIQDLHHIICEESHISEILQISLDKGKFENLKIDADFKLNFEQVKQ